MSPGLGLKTVVLLLAGVCSLVSVFFPTGSAPELRAPPCDGDVLRPICYKSDKNMPCNSVTMRLEKFVQWIVAPRPVAACLTSILLIFAAPLRWELASFYSILVWWPTLVPCPTGAARVVLRMEVGDMRIALMIHLLDESDFHEFCVSQHLQRAEHPGKVLKLGDRRVQTRLLSAHLRGSRGQRSCLDSCCSLHPGSRA